MKTFYQRFRKFLNLTEKSVIDSVPKKDNIEDDAGGRLTKCPVHGRKHLSCRGFNEHSVHADGTHGHTMWFKCEKSGCKTVIPDGMDYYERVHPEQLEVDKEFAKECMGELWLPNFLLNPVSQFGTGYRDSAKGPNEPLKQKAPGSLFFQGPFAFNMLSIRAHTESYYLLTFAWPKTPGFLARGGSEQWFS